MVLTAVVLRSFRAGSLDSFVIAPFHALKNLEHDDHLLVLSNRSPP